MKHANKSKRRLKTARKNSRVSSTSKAGTTAKRRSTAKSKGTSTDSGRSSKRGKAVIQWGYKYPGNTTYTVFESKELAEFYGGFSNVVKVVKLEIR